MNSMADERAELRAKLLQVLGEPYTTTLMRALPAEEGAELATRSDIKGVEGRLGHRMDGLEHRMDGLENRMAAVETAVLKLDDRIHQLSLHIASEMRAQTRTFVLASTASTAIIAAVFLGALTLG